MPDQSDTAPWLPPEFKPGLVSVVTPTFNRARLLLETLESIFKQDYRPIEVIVVDDGSTDDTHARLRELTPPDGISLEVLKGQHRGASAARNTGAAASHGEYVMFLDSDDVLHDGALAALINGIGDADMALGWWREWFSQASPPRFGREFRRTQPEDWLVALLKHEWPLQSASMYRRSALLADAGWDEGFTVQDDHEFTMRLAVNGARIAMVERLVTDYRQHGDGRLSHMGFDKRAAADEEVLRRVEAALDRTGWTPQRRAALAWRWYWDARIHWQHAAEPDTLRRLMAEARRVDPNFRPPKPWYRALAAIAGYVVAERVSAIGRKLLRR